jgi:DMSO/TMAO reductase YedYZ molybdopterin-dependent catalytic subunit
VRFADFLAAFRLGQKASGEFYPYVGLATPDEEYYVSLDMASMLHPKTMLAMAINGVPLTPEHGAPLRLIVPVKYGIKNIKRIGSIEFADSAPPDYWAERGYDWYAGL